MKAFSRKISIVILVFAMGIGFVANGVWADSYDPASPPGVDPDPQDAMIWNHGGQGDALLGDYYRALISSSFDPTGTTSFEPYFSIENVSDKWVGAFIRLRSGRYSIEVMRIPILLSPHDVFWFQMQPFADASGNITDLRIFSTDVNTLTRSALPTTGGIYNQQVSLSLLNEFTLLPTTQKSFAEAAFGYIEVFGLFALDSLGTPGPIADNATFNTIMDELWTGPGTAGAPSFNGEVAKDVEQYLTGRVFLGDFANGLYFGYQMRAIRDFRTNVGGPHRDINAVKITDGTPLRSGSGGAGTTAGGAAIDPATIIYNRASDDAYSEPDWATKFGPTWNDGDDAAGTGVYAVDSWSLDDIDVAFIKQSLHSSYFNTGFSGQTYTLVALTFPTKYLHYFFDCAHGGLLSGTGTCLGGTDAANRGEWQVNNLAAAASARGQLNIATQLGSVQVTFSAWNMEEDEPSLITGGASALLPSEVNFIAIGNQSATRLAPWGFLVNSGSSPFDLVTASADGAGNTFTAGHFTMSGFRLGGGISTGDPRTAEWNTFAVPGGYDRSNYTLLDRLQNAGNNRIIPVTGQVMDFEFTNFSHARAFDPSWSNPTN